MKFTIRDLFLLTLIVALIAGWWVDRNRLAARDAEWERSLPLLVLLFLWLVKLGT